MRTSVIFSLLALAGCGEVASAPDAPPEPPPPYLGVWQVTSGDLWNTNYGTPRFMEFDADGGGALRTRFEPAGVLGCGLEFLHAQPMDGVILVDIQGQRLYHYELPDDNTLVLTDQGGHALTLTRTAEIPAGAKCSEPQIAQTVSDIHLQLGSFSGLGIRSASEFWVANSASQFIVIDPSTGAATPAPTPSGGYEWIQAFEGANFWAHCGCGGSPEVALRTADAAGTQVDLVDTTAFGSAEISIRTAAVDGTTLWLGGFARDDSGYRLLKVTRTGPTTHELADNISLSNLQSIAMLDGALWAIARGTGYVLVRIDLTTMLATKTYALPADYQWRAMAANGGSLWIAGREPDGDMRLIRVTAPQ